MFPAIRLRTLCNIWTNSRANKYVKCSGLDSPEKFGLLVLLLGWEVEGGEIAVDVVVWLMYVGRTSTFINTASYEVSNPTTSQPSILSNSTLQSLICSMFKDFIPITTSFDSYRLKLLAWSYTLETFGRNNHVDFDGSRSFQVHSRHWV